MKNLATKLAEVMKAVERIPKNGWNDFHKYKFATEADIADAIRGELAQRGVVLIPAITGMEREKVGDKGQVLTTLFMEMTFVDGASGESISKPWLGAGTDKEDKGAYKAMTGGEKYFLLKTFLIPTGDDPEATDSHVVQKSPGATVPPVRAAQPSVPNGGGANRATSPADAQMTADVNAGLAAGMQKGAQAASRFKAPVKTQSRYAPGGAPASDAPPLNDSDIPF